VSSNDSEREALREWRLSAYEELRRARPDLFQNPEGAAYEIVTDRDLQDTVVEQSVGWNIAKGVPEQYADLGVVYEDPYVTLVKDAVRFRSGRLGPYIRMIPTMSAVTAGAAVLPLHDGKIVLVRHFRHESRTWHWEIPRGFGDAGEDSAHVAQREVEEELGARVLKLVPLGPVRLNGGVTSDLPMLYLAEITAPGSPETEEGIDEVRLISVPELSRILREGEVQDAFTLAALAYASAGGLLTDAS
jgi:ADP-ribose pyrophosphatase